MPAAYDASSRAVSMAHEVCRVTHNFEANNSCQALVGRAERRQGHLEEQVWGLTEANEDL